MATALSTMSLPLNIQELFTGRVVEWERLEFKEGWNPEAALHTMCAFANDFHNWGGGYIVLGVRAENGRPVLPPVGIQPEQADAWQRKLLELGHRLQPPYHPTSEPVTIDGKLVLVVWVPGGEVRPYKAPVSLAPGNHEWAYYVRLHANTVRAKGEIEREMLSLANRIPFDDRQNLAVPVSEMQPTLIQSFLTEVKSDLQAEAGRMPLEELGRRMQIVRGPVEAPRPLNVGLLFFTPDPTRWFPQTQIDIVYLPQGRGGDQIIEHTFKGPVGTMLRDALGHLRNNVVTQYVRKRPDRAEAERYKNVPYVALEEVLVNAIYHRSYEEREPIEVQITPEEITILSFPGPDPSIAMNDLRAGKALPRRYRNRRIGEFLKELELSEGRGTGISKILHAMRANGSPEPKFETDDQRLAFLVRLPLRVTPAEETSQVTPQVKAQAKAQEAQAEAQATLTPTDKTMLAACLEHPLLGQELLKSAGYAKRTGNFKRSLEKLLATRLLEMTLPDKPTSPSQQYRITAEGRAWLAKASAHRP